VLFPSILDPIFQKKPKNKIKILFLYNWISRWILAIAMAMEACNLVDTRSRLSLDKPIEMKSETTRYLIGSISPRIRDRSSLIEMKLFLPKKRRNPAQFVYIKRRVEDHFRIKMKITSVLILATAVTASYSAKDTDVASYDDKSAPDTKDYSAPKGKDYSDVQTKSASKGYSAPDTKDYSAPKGKDYGDAKTKSASKGYGDKTKAKSTKYGEAKNKGASKGSKGYDDTMPTDETKPAGGDYGSSETMPTDETAPAEGYGSPEAETAPAETSAPDYTDDDTAPADESTSYSLEDPALQQSSGFKTGLSIIAAVAFILVL
jgi:hypothetical protein